MTKLLNVLIVLLAAALVFIIVYPQVQQNRPLAVRIACDSTISALPILVGVEESLFVKEKILPEIVFYSNPDQALDDLFAGKTDVGVFPWSTVLKRLAEKGDTLHILASMDYRPSLPVDAIVVPVKSPIKVVTDLKGRRLVYPPQVRDYIPVFLTNLSLTPEQVKLQELPLSGLVEALRSGQADAAWLLEPLLCPLDTIQFRVVQSAALARYVSQPFPGACIGFSKAYAQRSRVASGRLKVSTDAAVAFTEGKANEARQVVSRYFTYCTSEQCGICRLPEVQRLSEINKPAVAALAARLKVAGVLKSDVETKAIFVDPSTLKR